MKILKVKSDENNYPLTEKQGQVADSEVRSDTNKSDNFGIKKYWWLIPVLGIVVAIAGVTSVRWQDTGTEETTTEITPLSVRTTKAVKEPIKNWISSEGTVRAVNYKHLAFEV